MVGVAVKVTEVPSQTGLAEAAIETLTARLGLTLMVNKADMAGLPTAQVALDVNVQDTASVFAGI